jgi:branched-subunit amino acid transport protein
MDEKIIYLILGMAAVTYIPRMLPVVILSKINLPDLLKRWLAYIPPAVLAALLAPSLLAPQGKLDLSITNLFMIAALPTFFVAIKKSNNLFYPVIIGIITIIILRTFF